MVESSCCKQPIVLVIVINSAVASQQQGCGFDCVCVGLFWILRLPPKNVHVTKIGDFELPLGVCVCMQIGCLSLSLCGDAPTLSEVPTCFRPMYDDSFFRGLRVTPTALWVPTNRKQPKSCTTERRWIRKKDGDG